MFFFALTYLPLMTNPPSLRVRVFFSMRFPARSCDDFNGAQLKAVCVEAGMLALRREGTEIQHEDFIEAITIVAAKKKGSLDYFA